MSYLKLKVKDVEYFECTDINNNKSQIIAKCVFENIKANYDIFSISEWKNDKGQTFRFGSKGSNVYLTGIYFDINENQEQTNYKY